jgi:hypothetical protein
LSPRFHFHIQSKSREIGNKPEGKKGNELLALNDLRIDWEIIGRGRVVI